jgi:hypothetical protein
MEEDQHLQEVSSRRAKATATGRENLKNAHNNRSPEFNLPHKAITTSV